MEQHGLRFYAAEREIGAPAGAGFNAWSRWSSKSNKHDPAATGARWQHFHRSPPNGTGTGALVKIAQATAASFRLPSWGAERERTGERPGGEIVHETPAPQEEPWPEPLAPEAYHGIAGEIVRLIEPETEADPAAILFQLLTAAGNLLGAGSYVRVEADRHPPRLFVVNVGKTAKGRKGTSWGRVREPLEIASPEWTGDRIVSGLSSGEGLIWEVRDPIAVKQKDKKTGEIEEVITDPGVADKRLLVVEGEFAKALRSMERSGNTLSAVLRDAWDRGDLRTLTKNSPARASGAHISIVGHITTDELRRYLDRTEAANGLANRILFVCAQRSKLLPRGGRPIDWSSIERRLRETLAAASNIGEVRRTEAAWRIWDEVYADLGADRPGLLGAVTARAEAQVVRLALIYALLDRQAFIDAPHMLAGLACWKYAEESARFIFGQTLGDPTADEILRLLRQSPGGMTRWELTNHFGRNLPASEMVRALAMLARESLAFCTKEPGERGGRPAERWRARA